jgi:hypothetical protein
VVADRYDVTEVVGARRRTRPPTWLFVLGLVIGWVLDAVVVVAVLHAGVGPVAAVLVAIGGYLLLPAPVVTVIREMWLRTHRDRGLELDRQLGDHVPGLRSWVDARVGEPVGLPPQLAQTWLLRPEPESARELLALPPEAGWRVGGVALSARHERTDGRTLLRLAVLPDTTAVADGPEPPRP